MTARLPKGIISITTVIFPKPGNCTGENFLRTTDGVTGMKLRLGRILVGLIFFSLLAFCFQPAAARDAVVVPPGTTRYVAPNGQDSGNCTSSASPCRTIQYAVNQAASGDTILVAAGVYTYEQGVDPCPFLQTRAVVCVRGKNLKIRGGFSLNNWQLFSPNENPTIIDGENKFRGVVVNGYNVQRTHLEMSGFRIQNGLAQGPTYLNPYEPGAMGGGLWALLASVSLQDMLFLNNKAIGANTTSGDGGGADGAAIRIESSPLDTTSVIERVVFENNTSIGGNGPDRGGVAFGALFIYKSNVLIQDALFKNNLAQAGSSNGSGVSKRDGLNADALGGAIGIEFGNVVTLKRVRIVGNQVKGGSGSIYGGGAFGGGILVEDTNLFEMYDSIVEGNIAKAGSGQNAGNAGGGGISSQNTELLRIERSMIVSNSSIGGDTTINGNPAGTGSGGGLYVFSTRPTISYQATMTNLIIADNRSQQGQGSLGPINSAGAGAVFHGIKADISHATIAGNQLDPYLPVGQAMIVLPWQLPSGSIPSTVRLSYSIVSDHSQGMAGACAIAVIQGSTLHLNQVLFARNIKDTNADGRPLPAGAFIGMDTIRTASSVKYVSPGAPNYNYRLRASSPAINSVGTSSIADDIDQQSRPYQNTADLGADEYWPFGLRGTVSDGEIYLDWEIETQPFSNAVAYYMVTLSCEPGASSPNEIQCGQSINVGNITQLKLTGLSNFKNYRIRVDAYDGSGDLIANSKGVTLFPTNIFIFLPLVVR